MTLQPLVSVVSPVYNEERYLSTCIESILAQDYLNWDYTIVDNCSTDRSFEIAEKYAKQDSRIRVFRNKQHLGAIQNHNEAFRSISPGSKYCKLVSGDDWLYSECLPHLVRVAECNPNVGIVGSYAITANGIRWGGLPHDTTVFGGRYIGRLFLLGLIDSFWVPSTVLYRSSLVRSKAEFFPGDAPSADLSACLNCLKESDCGFVHQILSFERMHDSSRSTKVRQLGGYLLDRINVLNDVWPAFLTNQEYADRLEALLDEYYSNVLAVSCFKSRSKEFWEFHRRRLRDLGYPLLGKRLAIAVGMKAIDLLLNPKQSLERVVMRIKAYGAGGDVGLHNDTYCDPVYRR
jgi:glycosyltransferase involved in cell wall biosynthesis